MTDDIKILREFINAEIRRPGHGVVASIAKGRAKEGRAAIDRLQARIAELEKDYNDAIEEGAMKIAIAEEERDTALGTTNDNYKRWLDMKAERDSLRALNEKAKEALAAEDKLIRDAQEKLCAYLHPDSGIDDRQIANSKLEHFDGPRQHEVQSKARTVLAERAADAPAQQRVRHKNRGSTYSVIGRGELQTSHLIGERTKLVVYQCTTDGRLWIRPAVEFDDGRFETLDDAPAQEPPK